MTVHRLRSDRLSAWLLVSLSGFMMLSVVLAILCLARGQPAHGFLNATSQWLHGPDAALTDRLDLAHSAVGLLTNLSACLFWGAICVAAATLLARRGTNACWMVGMGTALSARIIDYGILPRAVSPGWHLVLPPIDVALGFAAMGFGFALALSSPLTVQAVNTKRGK